ncbi:Zn-dependent hydrolase, glyoxylase [Saccharomonospora marina XMU15]|uniref:Zn-dependent hydrolase, glyoxylase n=1 Tax=Saccharomonospora marina XMU15 TaxID=882083 RepID=H5X6Q9_9PSEU|nr:Zn-dependent hydrolase, glyoxylase [Saccharomonospora marina XMU15]
MPWPIAPEVYCLGPSGRTGTNVFFVRAGTSWTLVDTGWPGDADRIERAAAALLGAGTRPEAILLTHCHPDHSGAAQRLARDWDCPVHLHADEVPIAIGDFTAMVCDAGPLDRWVVLPMLRALGSRRREAVLARSRLDCGLRAFRHGADVPCLPGWECVPTPGHTRGHVSYFRPGDGVLVTGDAVVTLRVNSPAGLLLGREGISGPPWYTTWDGRLARESVARLADLEPSVLACGHGTPMTGPGAAKALHALAERFAGH